MCSELAKSGQEQVIFKKMVSYWFLPFLTTFCVHIYIYVYIYIYIYIHKGGFVENPLIQILSDGPEPNLTSPPNLLT